MYREDSDYVSGFNEELQKTIATLERCGTLKHSVDDPTANSKGPLSQLTDTLDSAVLALRDVYLHGLDAQSNVEIESRLSAAAESECSSRLEMAADASDDFEELQRIYSSELDPKLDRDQSKSTVNLRHYLEFLQKLLDARGVESSPVSLDLCKTFYDDYKRLQSTTDDDELAVGTAVVKPVCPLSSQPLEQPVRSPCGHYFSKKNILDAISANNNSCKCPFTGCSQIITAKQLIRDPFKDLEVYKWKREEEVRRLQDTQRMTEV